MLTLINPLEHGQAPARFRTGQAQGDFQLPPGTRVVSADNHYELDEDIFVRGFPEDMKDKAPRVWFDEHWQIGYPDQLPTDPESQEFRRKLKKIIVGLTAPGAWDFELRRRDLKIEGIEKEIAYPNSLLSFIRHPDLAVQEQVYRCYNEHIARLGALYPGFYGVAVCSNWWDPAKARDAIRQIVDLGLRTFIVPTANPGLTASGKPINYGSEEMETFWAEAARAGLPVTFHVGENFSVNGRGAMASSTLVSHVGFRKPFGELIFGGVFDRHPELQVVFAEGGLNWLPSVLQDAEHLLDVHGHVMDYIPEHRPTHYWLNNCYATFQTDPLGLQQIDYLGVDRVMWSGDYPHNEGTLGYGWSAMQAVIDAVGPEGARKILGGTAIELYRLDE